MMPRSLPETNPSLITEMTYRTLMTSKEIPWHNPAGLTPEQVDPNIDGWRLATLDEVCANSPLRGKCERFLDSRWDADRWYCNSLNQTYRTREPLPEKYRHLVEPEIPAGLPPLPEPPAGHYLVHRGFGFNKQSGIFFMTADYGDGFHGWIKSIIAGGVPDVYYVEAVKIDQPAKDPEPDSDAHKLAEVIAAADAGKACEYWNEGHGKWISERTVADVARSIIYGRKVRIAPAPVKVPLSDYRVSEAIRVGGETRLITKVDLNGARVWTGPLISFTTDWLIEKGQIHRNGTWQDCFTLAD